MATLCLALPVQAYDTLAYTFAVGYPSAFDNTNDCMLALDLTNPSSLGYAKALARVDFTPQTDAATESWLASFDASDDTSSTWITNFFLADDSYLDREQWIGTSDVTITIDEVEVTGGCTTSSCTDFFVHLNFWINMDDGGDCDQDMYLIYYCQGDWDASATGYDTSDPDDPNDWILHDMDCSDDQSIIIQTRTGSPPDILYESDVTTGEYAITVAGSNAGQGCDSDSDGVPWCASYQVDNCPLSMNTKQEDIDSDGVGNQCDKCPSVYKATAHADADGDSVGDDCDNCVNTQNSWQNWAPAGRITSGYQLDEDLDGYGNACDADYAGLPNFVDGVDTIWYKTALNKLAATSTCDPTGTGYCGKYDYTESGPYIDALDTIKYNAMYGSAVGPKCSTCPITNW